MKLRQRRGHLDLKDRDPPTPAIILGEGITVLAVLRQFGRLGIPSYVASQDLGFVAASRWYRPLEEIAEGPPTTGALAEWLIGQALEHAMLVPCSDESLLEVASLPAELVTRFPACVPPPDVVRAVVDKSAFARLLEAGGIPHPRTEEITNASDLDHLDDELLHRAFLKPVHSQPFFRDFQRKAFPIKQRKDAKEHVEQILSRGHRLVVQEMIEGPASHHLCIDGFVDRSGTVRARFARRWLRQYPQDFGESCLSISVDLKEVAEAVALADQVLDMLAYRGVFNLELKLDPQSGKYQVLELNARPWWYIGFTCDAGVNVCGMAYADALGQPVSEVREYRTGLYSAHPELDWHANRRLSKSDRDGVLTVLRTWLTAVQPVFAWSDPGPWLWRWWQRLSHRLSNMAHRNPLRSAADMATKGGQAK